MIHIAPENDIIEHDTSEDTGHLCQCGPSVDVEAGIVVHDALDRRETEEED